MKNEDKIIFNQLQKQHDRIYDHISALDSKIAQAIAFNSVIIAFTFDKVWKACSPVFFIIGFIMILVSIVSGVIAFKRKNFKDSPPLEFYEKKEGIEKLKDWLIFDVKQNDLLFKERGGWFDAMLLSDLLGLIILVVSFYVKW